MSFGAVYMAQKKYGAASKAYEEALRVDPEQIDALYAITQLLVKDGKTREALTRAERHLEITKNRAAVFDILGELNVYAGDKQKSLGYFKQALNIDPNLASTYLKIGDLYASQEELDEAIHAYLKAAQLTPKSLQPRMLVAMMYDRKKEYAKANEIYKAILDVNGNFAPAANNLAWNIAEEGGNLDVAFRWAQKARDGDPQNPRVADTLGWISYKLGLFNKAIDLLKESNNRLGNQNPAMLYRLGMAYYSGGQRKEAREALTKALALSRNFKGADEATRIVAVLGDAK